MNKVICADCGNSYNPSYEKRHFSSKIHMEYMGNISDTLEQSESDEVDEVDESDDDFLEELNNKNNNVEEESIKEAIFKIKKTKPKVINYYDDDYDDDIYSNKPTQILGVDRHVLLSKIKQYKSLFKNKLQKFKIKKNPSVEDLKIAIDEMDAIIETKSVETHEQIIWTTSDIKTKSN